MISFMYYVRARLALGEQGASPVQYVLLLILVALFCVQLGHVVSSVPR